MQGSSRGRWSGTGCLGVPVASDCYGGFLHLSDWSALAAGICFREMPAHYNSHINN